MMNLFSSFNLSLNWMSITIHLLSIRSMFWMTPSRMNMLWNKIITTLNNEFTILLKVKKSKKINLIIYPLFSLIMINNMSSLFPYIFSSTSLLTLTLSLALPMWMVLMIYGCMNETIHMLSHLVPRGTPSALMPFMVLIVTTSNIIQPATLAIRLMANIITGHLLLTLLGNMGNKISSMILSLLIITQLLLLIFELAVAML